MNIRVVQTQGTDVATLKSPEILIKDVNTALDLIATVQYETGAHRIAMNKEAIAEEFFDLRSGLAGNILQKYINYRMKLAVYGDYTSYTSKALRDFIVECNRGKDFFFVANEEEAIAVLGNAK